MRSIRPGVRYVVGLCVLAVAALLVGASPISAQTHVVSPNELQQNVVEASRTRAANIDTLSQFLSSPKAEQVLQRAHMDPAQVKASISGLNDEELAQLSARAAKAQRDFAAGDLSDRDLLLILVGVAVIILIVVAVR